MSSYITAFWEWVYDVPMPNDERTVPMEVLALGLSRSGTETLKQALEILGYDPCYHGFETVAKTEHCKAWRRAVDSKWYKKGQDPVLDTKFFDTILGHYRATTDIPTAVFGPELIAAYPDAKVVLNYRDMEPWHRSATNTVDAVARVPYPLWHLHKHAFWVYRGMISGVWQHQFYPGFEEFGRGAYRDHYYTIKGCTKPENLLEWKIGEGWEPLCKFLGKPIPDQPFPKSNEGGQWDDRMIEDSGGDANSQGALGWALRRMLAPSTATLVEAELRKLLGTA